MANGALPQESQGRSLEGIAVRPSNDEELAEAIDLAFDYRGDVRLELRSGESIEGYLFNRDAEASPPFLQLYTLNAMQPITVFYDQIARILFSGEDTAFGKSWNDWVKKNDRCIPNHHSVPTNLNFPAVYCQIIPRIQGQTVP